MCGCYVQVTKRLWFAWWITWSDDLVSSTRVPRFVGASSKKAIGTRHVQTIDADAFPADWRPANQCVDGRRNHLRPFVTLTERPAAARTFQQGAFQSTRHSHRFCFFFLGERIKLNVKSWEADSEKTSRCWSSESFFFSRATCCSFHGRTVLSGDVECGGNMAANCTCHVFLSPALLMTSSFNLNQCD